MLLHGSISSWFALIQHSLLKKTVTILLLMQPRIKLVEIISYCRKHEKSKDKTMNLSLDLKNGDCANSLPMVYILLVCCGGRPTTR